MANVLRDLYREHNAKASLLALPIEIQIQILAYLTTRDKVATARACRILHAAVFNSPTLWTDIKCDADVRPELVSRQLRLSLDLPVSVFVDLCTNEWPELAPCIRDNMHRFTAFRITLPRTFATEDALLLVRCLQEPAPILRQLVIFDGHGHLQSKLDSKTAFDALFADESPLLRCVKLHTDLRTFRGLTKPLDRVEQLLWCQPSLVDGRSLGLCMLLFPQLPELAVELPDPTQYDHWPLPVALPPTLKDLSIIIAARHAQGAHPLHSIDHRSLDKITVMYTPDTWTPDRALEIMLNAVGPIRTVRLGSSSIGQSLQNTLDVFASPAHGPIDIAGGALSRLERERAVIHADIRVIQHLPPGIFADLTDLIAHECVLVPLPPLPRLVRLTLYMARGYRPWYKREGHCSAFFPCSFSEEVNQPVQCPSLHTLQIAQLEGETGVTWIGPEMVRTVIEERLVFDRPKLTRLVLLGVRLLELNVAEVVKLLDLVEDVVFEPMPPKSLTPQFSDLLHWS